MNCNGEGKAFKARAFVKLARPHQYVKNGFVWLPLFFGYRIADAGAVMATAAAFIAFCLAASAIYIINDLMDIEADRLHPVKKRRPLACGAVGKTEAVSVAIMLFAVSSFLSLVLLPTRFLFIIAVYTLLNIAYTFRLKHFAIVDIVCISVGFVLRVFAGGISADVAVSHWIILITFLSALFLALAKRRDDLLLSTSGINVRKSVEGYNLEFVSVCMVMLASITIVSYILYTVSPEIVKLHGNHMYMTSFWVIVGFLRYIQIAIVEQKSGSPTMVLLKDRFLQIVIALWGGNSFILLYILNK